MLRWPIRSALYIDYENIRLSSDAIANWLAWLEDGCFDETARRRRFLQKRVYWNASDERLRDAFEARGFDVILIDKFSGLKNGADIRMAMDVVESTYTRSEIDEFVLLTSDSDFVPVLVRLREKCKRSIVVANEHSLNIHTTYRQYADGLIPTRRLAEAITYVRPRGLLGRWRKPAAEPAPAKVAKPPAAANGSQRPAQQPRQAAPPARTVILPPSPAEIEDRLKEAAGRLAKLAAANPGALVSQRRAMAQLRAVPGFLERGKPTYFGYDSYRALMLALGERDTRIRVIGQSNGGFAIAYRPPGSDAASTDQPAEVLPPEAAPPKEAAAPAKPFRNALAVAEAVPAAPAYPMAGPVSAKPVARPSTVAVPELVSCDQAAPAPVVLQASHRHEEQAETALIDEPEPAGEPAWQRDRAPAIRRA